MCVDNFRLSFQFAVWTNLKYLKVVYKLVQINQHGIQVECRVVQMKNMGIRGKKQKRLPSSYESSCFFIVWIRSIKYRVPARLLLTAWSVESVLEHVVKIPYYSPKFSFLTHWPKWKTEKKKNKRKKKDPLIYVAGLEPSLSFWVSL